MATGNEELDQFKTQINFCEYAAAQGFILDPKQSSRASAVMRHANGDKIVVAKRPSGHWTYFSVHNNDSGSLIDFVMSQKSLSLGQVRKELRPWVGGPHLRSTPIDHSRPAESFELVPVVRDFQKVGRLWARASAACVEDKYLLSRGIVPSVLSDEVFSDRFRIDSNRNTIFPHWNTSGDLSGFEIKNNRFTGFSPGGEKGLWCSRPRSTDRSMIVCESAIDALSYATLFGTSGKRFFSVAGKCGPHQIVSLVSAAGKMPKGSEIVLAFDNDKSGRKMAADIREILIQQLVVAIPILTEFPEQDGFDWNDVLASKLQTCSPNASLKLKPT